MFEKICVVTENTALAAKAAELSAALERAFDAELTTAETNQAAHARARAAKLAATLSGESAEISNPPVADQSNGKKRLVGRRFKAVVDDVEASEYDLLVLGAVAEGEDEDGIGPSCERIARRSRTDTLVIKDAGAAAADAPGNILVCIDGSPQAYAGLMTAFELSKKLGKSVECVAVYDPYLHYTLFNGIVNVLTKEAEAVFKFKDQEKLHEEIIDTGLAKIYQAHLEVARKLGDENDVAVKITLLDGKAFEKILRMARKSKPWLLIAGRIGVHSDDTMDIGATAENLLRQAPCNLLLTSSKYVPRVVIQAEESVEWTPDAKAVMERVPSWVRGVATTSVLRWAIEHGHSVVTAKVINSAMGDILPPGAAQAMGYVAEEVAIDHDNLEHGNSYLCRNCGYAARDFRPVACPVCKAASDEFEEINREALQNLGKLKEGALEVEETFDGRRLTWTHDAKEIIRRVPSGYQRRRSKARIEKNARVRGLDTITREFALDIVQQDLADTSYLSPRGEVLEIEVKKEEKPDDVIPLPREESPLPWTDAAWKRICRVPIGFMRDMTREKVEQFAADKNVDFVDLELCEQGIAEGRRMMAEAMGQYKSGDTSKSEARVAYTKQADDKIEEAAERGERGSWMSKERSEEISRGAAEERAKEKKLDQIGQSFMAKLGSQLGYGHPLSQLTDQYQFTWTPEALERLEQVPSFCREMTKWRVEWTAVKKDLGRTITPEIMDVKFGMWGEVSEEIQEGERKKVEWAPETMARLENIPDFVRGQVIQSVEGNAIRWECERVDNDVLDRVIQKWIETGDFHEGKYGYKAKPE